MAVNQDATDTLRSAAPAAIVAAVLVLLGLFVLAPARAPTAEGEEAGAHATVVPRQAWSFSGVFGHYDKAQLQRGYRVYKEVCANCHSMRLLNFRNLSDPGGPGFTEAQVEALAAEIEVTEIGDDGEPKARPGKPSDAFKSPFANDQQARAANNGALPPDQSLIAKAREATVEVAWYLEPFKWGRDILNGYQEGGADYVHALMTGYEDAPAGFELAEGMNYNKYFDGHQIAMANPLSDGQVEYTDGSPATVGQYAKDVSAFFMWAAEPKLEERKHLGLRVILYLLITAVLLYLTKRLLWSRIGH